jgi:four helix bundle protein
MRDATLRNRRTEEVRTEEQKPGKAHLCTRLELLEGLDVTDGYLVPDYLTHMGHARHDLRARTREFAIRIVRVYQSLPYKTDAQVLGKQLLRSGTSVAANYRAVQRARSKADFISKMGIVIEEADETLFWLDLLIATNLVAETKLSSLMQEADELLSIFVASHKTVKH